MARRKVYDESDPHHWEVEELAGDYLLCRNSYGRWTVLQRKGEMVQSVMVSDNRKGLPRVDFFPPWPGISDGYNSWPAHSVFSRLAGDLPRSKPKGPSAEEVAAELHEVWHSGVDETGKHGMECYGCQYRRRQSPGHILCAYFAAPHSWEAAYLKLVGPPGNPRGIEEGRYHFPGLFDPAWKMTACGVPAVMKRYADDLG